MKQEPILSTEARALVERLEAHACPSCGAEPTLVTDGSGEERQVVHAKDCPERER